MPNAEDFSQNYKHVLARRRENTRPKSVVKKIRLEKPFKIIPPRLSILEESPPRRSTSRIDEQYDSVSTNT